MTAEARTGTLADLLDAWADKQVSTLGDLVQAAVRDHRRQFILGTPTDAARREFEKGVPTLIRILRLMHAQFLDPSSPHPRHAAAAAAALAKIETLWESEHPTDPETSERILAQYFPDEPRS